jgi:hypothetical protein
VSDGGRVETVYLNWTNEIAEIRKSSGHHPGWSFQEDRSRVGPGVLIFGGAFLVLTAIVGKLSDVAAEPEVDPTA